MSEVNIQEEVDMRVAKIQAGYVNEINQLKSDLTCVRHAISNENTTDAEKLAAIRDLFGATVSTDEGAKTSEGTEVGDGAGTEAGSENTSESAEKTSGEE